MSDEKSTAVTIAYIVFVPRDSACSLKESIRENPSGASFLPGQLPISGVVVS